MSVSAAKAVVTGLLIVTTWLTGCARPAPPNPAPERPSDNAAATPASPGPGSPAVPGSPVVQLPALRREELDQVPPEVRAWVDQFRHVSVGVARTFGDRTFLLVSAPDLCPQFRTVDFRFTLRETPEGLEIPAFFSCTTRETGQPLALASMPADQRPVSFVLEYWWLPAFKNPHNLPETALPADRRGVLVEPKAGAALAPAPDGTVRVAGFASGLFEGTVLARIVDQKGEVLKEAPTIAAGGMGPDWGSFEVKLDVKGIPPGSYRLQIGDYSPKDGAWDQFDQVPVTRP